MTFNSIRLGSSCSHSAVPSARASEDVVQGVRDVVPVLTCQCGVAFVVSQGFNSSPHTPQVIVLKMTLNALFVPALYLSDAFYFKSLWAVLYANIWPDLMAASLILSSALTVVFIQGF